ncbi:hypothetical protein NWP96_05990 [Mycoplasmopsis cynos]|uniref:hypothetical protein n=1 Tax=Mycoplasmopsis cynos TaxID=171284 RepID=UPI0024C944D9|nr:hypothetical protein [Mycoplasmopsis cynos]MCU9936623.1 hypothetical protein [Mycoplasmopsis cynos]WAM04032.1 hypothetical protein ONA22_03555 [Mycoplasmopsis cynos]
MKNLLEDKEYKNWNDIDKKLIINKILIILKERNKNYIEKNFAEIFECIEKAKVYKNFDFEKIFKFLESNKINLKITISSLPKLSQSTILIFCLLKCFFKTKKVGEIKLSKFKNFLISEFLIPRQTIEASLAKIQKLGLVSIENKNIKLNKKNLVFIVKNQVNFVNKINGISLFCLIAFGLSFYQLINALKYAQKQNKKGKNTLIMIKRQNKKILSNSLFNTFSKAKLNSSRIKNNIERIIKIFSYKNYNSIFNIEYVFENKTIKKYRTFNNLLNEIRFC